MTATTKLPPDPRTIAEMIPVREAEIKARDAKPRCHIKGHGVMLPRDLKAQTYEQLWCGVWYDCQAFNGNRRCLSSATYSSRELAAYHGEPYVIRDGEYETWNGTGWQPITKAEFDAYWVARLGDMARWERQQAEQARRTRRAKRALRPTA